MKCCRLIVLALIAVCMMTLCCCKAEEEPKNAAEAVILLKEGNKRFVDMRMEHPNLTIISRETAAKTAQKPFAVVLGCSDSRVPVEYIFDRGIGDVFVIRVAGNVVMDADVIGSAEYAVEHLGASLLVVMGHTGCGAVKAGISGLPLTGSIRDIQKKIETVAVRVRAENPDLSGDELMTGVVKANVLQAKRDLLDRSEDIRHEMSEEKLTILTALYNMRTGVVEWIE